MSYEPIFIEGKRKAVLNYGATATPCASVQEAKTQFDRLSKDRQEIATIVADGKTYDASEIRRMQCGSAPTE